MSERRRRFGLLGARYLPVELLPSSSGHRERAEKRLRDATAAVALVGVVAALFLTLFSPSRLGSTAPPLAVAFVTVLVLFFNAYRSFRFIPPRAHLVLLILHVVATETAFLHLHGSTSDTISGIYVILILVACVYFSPAAGVLATAFSLGAYGSLLLLEANGVIEHAPLFPAKAVLLEIPGLFRDAFLNILVLTFCTLALGVYITRQIRRAQDELELRVQERTAELSHALEGLRSETQARSEAEGQLRQAQKMEAVGLLAGGIAHDFNNLLTVIIGHSKLQIADMQSDDRHRSSVEAVLDASDRASELTARLLAYSRKQVLQPQTLDLNEAAFQADRFLQRLLDEDIERRLVLGEDLGAVEVDPAQLQQAIVNLAVNARDAMPRGGTLEIETETTTLDETQAAAKPDRRAGDFVTLSLSDTGSGMDEEAQARAFEPFFTTKDVGEGSGLGLSMVHGFAKQSGGWIELESEPGRGSTFRLYLPKVSGTETVLVEDDQALVAASPRGEETVLVVEDEPGVRNIVVQMLEQQGYTVLSASSPEDVLHLLESYPAPIDLLLTDVVMPGMSGPEVVEWIQERRPTAKVLYMSGYTDSTVLKRGVHSERTPYLQKPFTLESLSEKVREVLNRAIEVPSEDDVLEADH